MEVPITQFRQEIFDLVTQALDGKEVWVIYKGRRFRIAPEDLPSGRLSRITPLRIVNPESDLGETGLLEEMTRSWEQDWSTL